ncbi:MAG: hypothetical protein LKF30_07890 [Sphingobium sp.]|jgi:RsiW-degrading membrane proteinase PrsW (M82 family)|nr:hypothetical protein [Sphingobium sp.]MCI1272655.1 hypothetical protein [Sphingobium sp.]MCI2052832.1 hypothetical protein [Sphingobium sp.]
MIEFAALTYGMVLSFVFASLHGNAKRQQKNPPIMILVGYFLVGVTALLSAVLFGLAFQLFRL